MKSIQQEVDERTQLTAQNKFELMLFRLGKSKNSDRRAVYGINVFKIRELMAMPDVMPVANSGAHIMGVINVRGQIVQVIDLPSACGCTPQGHKILMITEYARTTQAFAVEDVEDIVRLEWSQVKPADGVAGAGDAGSITSIAHLDQEIDGSKLAQVLDVEQILRDVNGSGKPEVDAKQIGAALTLPPGSSILFADDSASARMLVESALQAMKLPYIMTKSGKEAWNKLLDLAEEASKEGLAINDKVSLVLTDLEMPEMDGFTLTRNIKSDSRFKVIPVIIHSSLSGDTNENHVRSVGANGYVAKFNPQELATAIRRALADS